MSANSRYEAQRIFEAEVRPVSWAWRNAPKSITHNRIYIPWGKSSYDYWRDKLLAEDNNARNAPRERLDDLGATDWVSVRCGYG